MTAALRGTTTRRPELNRFPESKAEVEGEEVRHIQQVGGLVFIMSDQRSKKTGSGVFVSDDRECIWMKAKVVNSKLCDHDCDCEKCPFDKGMKAAWKQESEDRETLT